MLKIREATITFNDKQQQIFEAASLAISESAQALLFKDNEHFLRPLVDYTADTWIIRPNLLFSFQ